MSAERGFSLVEVLCALTIAAMGVVMLMQMVVSGARMSRALDAGLAARLQLRALRAADAAGEGASGGVVWRVVKTPATGQLADIAPGLPWQLIERRIRIEPAQGPALAVSEWRLERTP
ncbi:MAG: prepilin-type N-terminal cleavage/methylation domain-containing protein [Aestuariivirgaceae bacterium]|nr:prepilin-type N-terminal cleavage/methylation domain-containing protein [Aestuariivirgaceae bacterium]